MRLARQQCEFVLVPHRHQFFNKRTLGVEIGVRLGDDVLPLFDGREVLHVIRHFAVLDLAIWRLEEAVVVGASIDDSELIRPMFGPSGVSIGHTRP